MNVNKTETSGLDRGYIELGHGQFFIQSIHGLNNIPESKILDSAYEMLARAQCYLMRHDEEIKKVRRIVSDFSDDYMDGVIKLPAEQGGLIFPLLLTFNGNRFNVKQWKYIDEKIKMHLKQEFHIDIGVE